MRLKIISNGCPWETHIVNAKTGEEVEKVSRIVWEITAMESARAIVEIFDIEAVLEAECSTASQPEPEWSDL